MLYRDGIIQIKKNEHSERLAVHQINLLYDTFPDFEFFNDDGPELFHDASPNISGQSS